MTKHVDRFLGSAPSMQRYVSRHTHARTHAHTVVGDAFEDRLRVRAQVDTHTTHTHTHTHTHTDECFSVAAALLGLVSGSNFRCHSLYPLAVTRDSRDYQAFETNGPPMGSPEIGDQSFSIKCFVHEYQGISTFPFALSFP